MMFIIDYKIIYNNLHYICIIWYILIYIFIKLINKIYGLLKFKYKTIKK